MARTERGDPRGGVDIACLETNLQHLGVCHVQLGQHARALPRLERAIAAGEQGVGHGLVTPPEGSR
jgi:hypothetical protein